MLEGPKSQLAQKIDCEKKLKRQEAHRNNVQISKENEQSEHCENRPQEPSPPSHVEIVNTSKSHPVDAEHVSIVEPSIAPHTKQRTVTARYKGLSILSKFQVQTRKAEDDCAHFSIQRDSRHAREQDEDLRIRVHLHVERRKIRHKAQELTQNMYPLSPWPSADEPRRPPYGMASLGPIGRGQPPAVPLASSNPLTPPQTVVVLHVLHFKVLLALLLLLLQAPWTL